MLKDLAPHPWPLRPLGQDMALMFGVYALLAYLALVVARQPGSIATVWFADGAAIALLASAPRQRQWPLLAAAACADLCATLLYGDTFSEALAFVPANVAEVVLGTYLIKRTRRAESFATDVASLLQVLLAGAVLPPLAGALLGALTLQDQGRGALEDLWTHWYIGAVLGSVAVIPLVLALRASTARAAIERFADPSKLLSLAATVAATLAALHYTTYPFVVVSVVLLTIAFVRPRLTTFATSAAMVATLSMALAWGWFEHAGPHTGLGHTLVFSSALLVIVPAQVVSVLVARQRALADMLAAVGSRADDIVVFADMSGRYRWMNKAREAYWGESNEKVLGKTLAEGVDATQYASVIKPQFDAARAGQATRRMADFDYPSRGRRTMDMQMQPARDEEGHQIGVLFCATDVTELEQSRCELERTANDLRAANSSLEQFVRISSHDLREPLNTIVQFCELIEAEHTQQLSSTGQAYFTHVRKGALRMKVMLDDVLQYMRLEGTRNALPERVDLDDLADEVVSALAARVRSTQAQISMAALGAAFSQRTLLSLVLQNLVSNALKFVPAGRGPVVEISAQRTGGELRLSVRDNGIGIAPDRIGELGTPFRRLHSRRTFEGTGMGLAICWRIAEQLGARMEVQSAPDEGSTFTLVLPSN